MNFKVSKSDNMETRETILQKAETILREVYKDFRLQGIEAVYLWGSILRDDFHFETGDIDSIAIVDDMVSFELEQEIRMYLIGKVPEIKKFGFRVLYKSELSGGQIKSFLATVQSPKSHILDLPNWKHVAGKKFVPTDFRQTLPTYHEALLDELPEMERRARLHQEGVVAEDDYYIKKIAQLLDLLQKDKGARGAFSYSNLISRAEGEMETQVAATLNEIKLNSYNPQIIKKYDNLLKGFVHYINTLG